MYGFCLTFTANLSKKIHAKNLKIFYKKNLFLGCEKRGFFFGGGEFSGKNVQVKKKRLIFSQKKISELQLDLVGILWLNIVHPRKKWGVGGEKMKLVGREILNVVKLGG